MGVLGGQNNFSAILGCLRILRRTQIKKKKLGGNLDPLKPRSRGRRPLNLLFGEAKNLLGEAKL